MVFFPQWKRMMNLSRYTLLLLTFLGVPGWKLGICSMRTEWALSELIISSLDLELTHPSSNSCLAQLSQGLSPFGLFLA
jgi:hypothetical protein